MRTTQTEMIAGRYRLREQLGRGGMGVVWRARDERLERGVAIKILHPWVADDEDLRCRFEREASALAQLEHPNVVRLYDVVEDGGRTALVLELVEGDSLAASRTGRPQSWDEVRALLAPVAAGLAHAHARGVVHRDLTPANVLVERGTGRPVISDFGLARLARAGGSLSVSGILAGTPEYWAPEQAAGRETGPATDLYALGVMLFELLSGRPPFEGEDRLAVGLRRTQEDAPRLRELVPAAPPEACDLVDRLLARDRAERPDAVAAARALGAATASLPGRATAHDAVRPAGRARKAAVTLELETRVLWPGEHELPTTVLTPPAAAPPAPAAQLPVRRDPARAARRRRRAVLTLAGAAAALTLGGVYAVASDPPAGIDAPDVVGRGVDAARGLVVQRATAKDVLVPKVRVVDRSYSESVPTGRVLAQDPAPGERIVPGGALLVSVSRGSAFAAVPSVAGLDSRQAVSLLERAGFVTNRRFAPSTEIEAWHALTTEPAAGTRVERPVTVTLIVSTGPPRIPIPRVAGRTADDAAAVLRDAGFVPVVQERRSNQAPGTILRLDPAAGARTLVGSTVTIVVAREPLWTPLTEVTGEESIDTGTVALPTGARLRLETENGSFLDLAPATVSAVWTGDADGAREIDAGDDVVLLEPTRDDRTVAVTITVTGDAAWRLVVETAR